ncbi:unnamed protein product [Brugia timori]|uniref:ALIX V-shaped domain-containing protein n=1 Tax=Brugia timori TaxID=42155 RepID=A0A3P7TXP3_9BILA|nr:unnamed protein product [Brugia timori]
MRSQFKDKWTRMTSDQLTAPLHQECGKYRGILHAASNADETVKQKLEENREGIKLLTAIPGLDSSSANKNSEAVIKLRNLMDVIQEIKIGREKLEKEFTNVHCDMSSIFLKALADNQVINEEEISVTKIREIYGPLKAKVNETIKKQEECLAQVEIWNKKFCSEKASSQGAVERERILKILANGHDKFLEIKSNLDEGTKFYNDLTPLLLRLQQKVSDFCFARQTEKEDLMKQLQQNIVSDDKDFYSEPLISSNDNSGSSNGSAPPRPPPPKAPSTALSNNPFDIEAPIPPPRNLRKDGKYFLFIKTGRRSHEGNTGEIEFIQFSSLKFLIFI